MTTNTDAKHLQLNPTSTRVLLIGAQLLALIAFLLALQFLWRTTGGTLFLFSMIAPVSALLAALAVLGLAVYRFLRRHSLFEVENVEVGQVIFRQGEEGDCAYFIQSGKVDVVREEGGAERVVATLSKGQYFGEMALISDVPRNATVRAVTAARLAVLGKENFLTMLRVMPRTEEDIMKTVNERAMQTSEK
ncbi:MAG TPA: cyclic nucleotide-binding domain-containing protein [Candidatus Acidoferrum sp.]|nr:cyclic nucleotide-binding domain-containing protein [Candidatus Acidoferrum sp.]